MALPITTGANPEDVTVEHSKWTKTHSSVHKGIVKNLNAEYQDVYLTYLTAGSTAPTTLEEVPTWPIPIPPIKVSDSETLRDIYVWAVDTDALIRVEA